MKYLCAYIHALGIYKQQKSFGEPFAAYHALHQEGPFNISCQSSSPMNVLWLELTAHCPRCMLTAMASVLALLSPGENASVIN
jgi:hypothetical protein